MQHAQNDILIRIAGSNSFSIHTIQWLIENDAPEEGIAQRNNHFKLIWITRGSCDFCIDLQRYRVQNSQLFFVNPGQVYQFRAANEPEGYIISFTQESGVVCNSSIFRLFANTNGIQVGKELESAMKGLAEKMMNEYNNIHSLRDEMLRGYLNILFIYLLRQFDGALHTMRQTRNTELVQKFMSLLDTYFKTEKTVAGYAALLSITPNYLNETIKRVTGYSAGHHIRQRIVLEAKRQATYSDTCMKQIGYYLGFNDMAHFSRYFKSAAGMNFSDFKKAKTLIAMVS